MIENYSQSGLRYRSGTHKGFILPPLLLTPIILSVICAIPCVMGWHLFVGEIEVHAILQTLLISYILALCFTAAMDSDKKHRLVWFGGFVIAFSALNCFGLAEVSLSSLKEGSELWGALSLGALTVMFKGGLVEMVSQLDSRRYSFLPAGVVGLMLVVSAVFSALLVRILSSSHEFQMMACISKTSALLFIASALQSLRWAQREKSL